MVILSSSNKKASGIDLPDSETSNTTLVFVERTQKDTEVDCPELGSETVVESAAVDTDAVESEPEPRSPVTTESLGEFIVTY
jgi:DUF1009 family protein